MPFTRFRFHIVFATKGRAKWIDAEIEEFLYPVLISSAARNDGKIITLGGVEDHVHLIAAIKPKVAPSHFIDRTKSESSGAIRRNFRRRRNFKWQVGFGAFTLSALDYQDAVRYVEKQKEHHRRGITWSVFEEIMEEGFEEAA
ncbi:IS200/IS605 family transposase [Persicimonas caeni]|nr:IS200/IS605 family transposase [Persicimonas caeni]